MPEASLRLLPTAAMSDCTLPCGCAAACWRAGDAAAASAPCCSACCSRGCARCCACRCVWCASMAAPRSVGTGPGRR